MSLYSVSIITLTYNNWSLLDSAIESVFSQCINNAVSVEYLIVDDGTVGFDLGYVRALVDKYGSSSDISVKIIVNPVNVGTVKSFNSAISMASGDIIIPLSSDDKFSSPNVVDIVLSEFESSGAKIITAKRNMIMPGSDGVSVFPCYKLSQLFNPSRCRELLSYIVVHNNIISGASTYYHKDIFDIFGRFDEKFRLLEDYPFYFNVLSCGGYIHFLDVSTIDYYCCGVSSNGGSLYKIDVDRLLVDMANCTKISWLEKTIAFYRRFHLVKNFRNIHMLFMIKICDFIVLSDRCFFRIFDKSFICFLAK